MIVELSSQDLERLFRDPAMFDSRDDWRDAGFEVLSRSSDDKIMVASHSSVPRVLFKKYASSVSLEEQRQNYERRVEGARRLRALIEAEHLRHVVVPKKQLLELPRTFSRKKAASHVLVVEHLEILGSSASKEAYRGIGEDVLRELCLVFFEFRGLDSSSKNAPFTRDGQIAFIDTEHWDRRMNKKSKTPFLHHLGKYLPRSRRDLAEEILRELKKRR